MQARKRISLDNSALEKIPRKLSQAGNTQPLLACCSEDSGTVSSTTSAETIQLEQKFDRKKGSSEDTSGSHGSRLNDLVMEEMCTMSAMSQGSGDTTSAAETSDKGSETASRCNEPAARRLHSHRLPPHAYPVDVEIAPGKRALLALRGRMAQAGRQQRRSQLLAERVGGTAARAHAAETHHGSSMRKSVSLTNIVDKKKDRSTMSTAMQSFLYQPNAENSGSQCTAEESHQSEEAWGSQVSPAPAPLDGNARGQAQAYPIPPAQPPVVHGRPLKILIAEDNKINQLVTRKVVGKVRPSCEIDIVSDGEAALLTILEKPEYDLVLMDLHMPRMDGLEATRRVRERHPSRPLIVALTADTVVGTRQKCIAAGMNEYVSKPFHVQDMQRILQMCG